MNDEIIHVEDSEDKILLYDSCDKIKYLFNQDSYFNPEKNKNCQLKKNIAEIISYNDFIERFAYYTSDYGVVIDFRYFKIFAKPIIYDTVINHCSEVFDKALHDKSTFIIHLNLQGLSIIDIERLYTFICKFATVMKEKYPVQLERCNLYNSPFIVNQLLCVISLFINKETQRRFKVV